MSFQFASGVSNSMGVEDALDSVFFQIREGFSSEKADLAILFTTGHFADSRNILMGQMKGIELALRQIPDQKSQRRLVLVFLVRPDDSAGGAANHAGRRKSLVDPSADIHAGIGEMAGGEQNR